MADRKIGYSLTAEEKQILESVHVNCHCSCHRCDAVVDVLYSVLSRESYSQQQDPQCGVKRELDEEDNMQEPQNTRPSSFRKV